MALIRSLLSHASRLSAPLLGVIPTRFISTNAVVFPMFFRASLPMLAEPLKRKKKMDPAVIRAREERKKKRIEKTIRKLEKNSRKLKPIEENEVNFVLTKEKMGVKVYIPLLSRLRARSATLSTEEVSRYNVLLKEWTNYKFKQHLSEIKMIDRIETSQQKALDHLKSISEPLYIEAIQVDLNLLPFNTYGPVATPPQSNYETPDGDYIDISTKWI